MSQNTTDARARAPAKASMGARGSDGDGKAVTKRYVFRKNPGRRLEAGAGLRLKGEGGAGREKGRTTLYACAGGSERKKARGGEGGQGERRGREGGRTGACMLCDATCKCDVKRRARIGCGMEGACAGQRQRPCATFVCVDAPLSDGAPRVLVVLCGRLTNEGACGVVWARALTGCSRSCVRSWYDGVQCGCGRTWNSRARSLAHIAGRSRRFVRRWPACPASRRSRTGTTCSSGPGPSLEHRERYGPRRALAATRTGPGLKRVQPTRFLHFGKVYEGLTFKVGLKFPASYPHAAPTVTFETKCFHPNVDEAGNICLDILKVWCQLACWTHASLTVRTADPDGPARPASPYPPLFSLRLH